MGDSPSIVAIFGHFENALIFRILAFFSSHFLHRTACFRQFYFLTQTEYFAWAIAFGLWYIAHPVSSHKIKSRRFV